MPERNTTKAGVRGWRAFFLVFGCGTTAALLTVGIIVGGVRLVFSGTDEAPGGGGLAASRAPRESTEPGLLDVCEMGVESSGMLSNPVRQDERDEPVDSATTDPSAEPRTVTDDCTWAIVGTGGRNQEISLVYEAFMSDPNGQDKTDLAIERFESDAEDAESEFTEILDDSPPQGVALDDAVALFGEPAEGDPDTYRFTLVGRVKSSVIVIRLDGPQEEGSTPEEARNAFFAPIRDVLPYIKSDLERIVPD